MIAPATGHWMEFPVQYAGGLDGYPPRSGGVFSQGLYWSWTYRMNETGVELVCKYNKMLSVKQSVAKQSWENLGGVALTPSHTTSNQAAILMFGALGLASRIPWMLMKVQFAHGATFDIPQTSGHPYALFALNAQPQDIVEATETLEREWPQAIGKFRLLADIPVVQTADSEVVEDDSFVTDLADQLERISDLYRRGSLSKEEFERAKHRLLG